MSLIKESQIRTKTFVAFNIRLHPHHQEGIYLDFLNFLMEEKFFSKTGYKYNLIGIQDKKLEFLDKNSKNIVLGNFIRYTNIDEANWLDVVKNQIVPKDEIKDIIKIPNHFKLDGAIFNFCFLLKEHILIVELDATNDNRTATTANTIRKYFLRVFSRPEFKKSFKDGVVTSICHGKSIKDLLENPRLKFIEYVIRRPNPDILTDIFEHDVKESMEETHSDEYRFQMHAQTGKYLYLTEKNKKFGEIAADNGEVNAWELPVDSSHYKKISTTKIPLEEHINIPDSLNLKEKWKVTLRKLKLHIKKLSKIDI